MHALPTALAPLAAFRQFIIYTLVPSTTRPGKTDKFPCDFRTGRVASAHDATIWTDAQTAIAAAAHYNAQGGPYPFGVGFTLTDNDPFWFLDIDGAFDGQAWSPLSLQLVAAFPGAAVEVSSSHKGLHIFGTGAVPPHKTKNKEHGLEFYHTGRFVALTGINAVGDASLNFSHLLPSLVAQFFPPDAAVVAGAAQGWTTEACEGWNGPEDDDKLIERALRSQSSRAAFGNGASFADLWNCNVDVLARAYPDAGSSSTPYDASSADSALAQHLAFWTGKNCERIERLMRRSQLVREKWSREDYLPRTILAVCARQLEVLTDKAPEPLQGIPSATPAAPGAYNVETTYGAPSAAALSAARPTEVQGATFLTIEQQMQLFTGCVYICDAHRVLVPGGLLLKESQFKVMYGGYSFPMDAANERTVRCAWEAFTQSQAYRSARADTSAFLPDQPPGAIIHRPGQTVANTYWPIETPRQAGDISPFLTHLAKVLPNERDRQILLSYMAAIVQHKGQKFQWAPLLQGVEGNGKTLFTLCVAFAVGDRYTHLPSALDLADKFNDWMVGKIFIGVEDVYVPGERADILEALKPMVTNKRQQIQGKGKDKYTGDVCSNWILNTNHNNGIPITDKSRRYAPFFCAQQTAADLVRDGMTGDYFPKLYAWLRNGGYAIVNELLHTYPIADEFNPATQCQRAPTTSSTAEAIEVSRGGLEQEILEAVAQGLPGFSGGWISSLYLDRLVDRLGLLRRMSVKRRTEVMASLGYVPHPGLSDGRVDNVVMPDGGRPRLFVKPGTPAAMLQGAPEIARAYTAAQEGKISAPTS